MAVVPQPDLGADAASSQRPGRARSILDLVGKTPLIEINRLARGLSPRVRSGILRLLPRHLLLVSCDPPTFARDLSALKARYTVTVPTTYNVHLGTSGGDIHVSDLHGEAICKTSGGNLDLGNIQGNVDAKTSGGDVKLASATGKAGWSVTCRAWASLSALRPCSRR